MRYTAWGEVRYNSGVAPTNYTYTGQYSYANDFGLLFYNARWYDPSLGRFAQADSIVPGGVQGLDRYAYVNNSPMNYVDPSGHDAWWCNDQNCQANYSNSMANTGGGHNNNSGNTNQNGGGRYMGDEFQSAGGMNPAPVSMSDLLPFNGPQACEYILHNSDVCNADYSSFFDTGNPYSIPSLQRAVSNEIKYGGIGVRGDMSLWIMEIGIDFNFDLMYFLHSNELGIFLTPGFQSGQGTGASGSGGILLAGNMVDRGSYSGNSITVTGFDAPTPWFKLEGDYSTTSPSYPSISSMPQTIYLGIGPNSEVGVYTNVGLTIDLLAFFGK